MGVSITDRGRGIVPSGSGVGLRVRESIGAGGGSDRTVSGVRSGDVCGAGIGSRTFGRYWKLIVLLGECGYDSNHANKESRLALRLFIGA
jgi:hypothetical protein